MRGSKPGLEIKGLIGIRPDALAAGVFSGSIERWSKWTSPTLHLGGQPTIAITKRRWLRKFSTDSDVPTEVALNDREWLAAPDATPPIRGCNVELTQVTVGGGKVWWTLGFEAFGTLDTVENDLQTVAATLQDREPPRLDDGILASYPAWLSSYSDIYNAHTSKSVI